MNYSSLSYKQKLQALHDRFYSYMKWEPKVGDYYTTCRNDLELYQILEEDELHFYTVYCSDPDQNKSKWVKDGFNTKDFGIHRTHVSTYILEHPYFGTVVD